MGGRCFGGRFVLATDFVTDVADGLLVGELAFIQKMLPNYSVSGSGEVHLLKIDGG